MKKFRLLLTLATMFALVVPFTSCTDDKADDVKKPTVALAAGVAGEASISFTVSTSNATEAYYWVYPAEQVVENFELADGTSVATSQTDDVKAEPVTVTGLTPGQAYKVYASAMNFLYATNATPIEMVPAAVAPAAKAAVVIDEDSVESDQFVAVVSTLNADKAAYLVVEKYTEVSAAKVLAEGVALTAEQLNKAEVRIAITGLTALASYDVYVAAENAKGAVLSEVASVTLPDVPLVELEITSLNAASIMTPAMHGIPGVYWLQMVDAVNYTCNVSMMFIDYQNTDGYLSNGFFPLNADASFDPTMGATSAEDLVLLSNPGYTAIYGEFDGKEVELFPVAGQDPESFGAKVQTLMPNENNNIVQFFFECKTEADPAATKATHVVMGSYMGAFEGYQAGGNVATTERELDYKNFLMMPSANEVTLEFADANSTFKLYVKCEGGVLCPESGKWYQYSVEQGTVSKSSFYWEPLDDWWFYVTEGGFRVKKESETVYWFYLDGLKAEMTEPKQMICTFTDSGAWKPTLF